MPRTSASVHGPERATNGVRSRRADVTKAAELLGFTSSVDLTEGLADLVRWWRSERRVAAEAAS